MGARDRLMAAALALADLVEAREAAAGNHPPEATSEDTTATAAAAHINEIASIARPCLGDLVHLVAPGADATAALDDETRTRATLVAAARLVPSIFGDARVAKRVEHDAACLDLGAEAVVLRRRAARDGAGRPRPPEDARGEALRGAGLMACFLAARLWLLQNPPSSRRRGKDETPRSTVTRWLAEGAYRNTVHPHEAAARRVRTLLTRKSVGAASSLGFNASLSKADRDVLDRLARGVHRGVSSERLTADDRRRLELCMRALSVGGVDHQRVDEDRMRALAARLLGPD